MKNGKLKSIAVFSLAIAMALSVVVLSLSNAILLRPPLAREADRLVTLYTVASNHANEGFSYPDYEYVRDHSRIFSGVAAISYDYYRYAASYRNRDEVATVNALSDNYFEVMGIRPFLGRFFTSGDDRRRAPAAVLTYFVLEALGRRPRDRRENGDP